MNSEANESDLSQLKNEKSNSSKVNSFWTNKYNLFIIFLFIIFFIYSRIINYKIKQGLNKIEELLSKNQKLEEETKYLREELYNKAQNNSKNLVPDSIELLKLLTNNDEDKYKGTLNCLIQDSELCIYRFLCPREVVGKKRVLIGKREDGGYVLLDDFENIKIAYSFGINYNVHFDQNLADRGIDIYMYDHTIDDLPYKNSKFHWKKIGLGGIAQRNNVIKTLDELIKENGHSSEDNMILKIDIEWNEWSSLKDLPNDILNKFKYITMEMHFGEDTKLYYDVLKKLNETHQVFYLHCHNGANIIIFGNNRICQCLEVSYIIRKGNIFIQDKSIYPIEEFDFIIDPNKPKSPMNLNILKIFDY